MELDRVPILASIIFMSIAIAVAVSSVSVITATSRPDWLPMYSQMKYKEVSGNIIRLLVYHALLCIHKGEYLFTVKWRLLKHIFMTYEPGDKIELNRSSLTGHIITPVHTAHLLQLPLLLVYITDHLMLPCRSPHWAWSMVHAYNHVSITGEPTLRTRSTEYQYIIVQDLGSKETAVVW